VLLWLEKEQSYTEQDCSNPHYPISAMCIHRLLFVVLACAITFVAAMLLTYWSRLEPVIEGGRVSFSLFFLIVKLQRILKICRVIGQLLPQEIVLRIANPRSLFKCAIVYFFKTKKVYFKVYFPPSYVLLRNKIALT